MTSANEVADTATATRLLASWRAMLHECFHEPLRSRHPVFVALQPTIATHSLPIAPFDDLITAFEQDQRYPHHESLATLEEYSRFSANPVGRLVLLVSGYQSDELFALSDEICTGLQLANFYQDIVTDWGDRGRRYLPADAMARFGVTDEQLAARRFDENFRHLMEFLVADARARLVRGQGISQRVRPDLAATLSLFAQGGHAILDAIAAQGYDTLRSRPIVSKAAKLRLLGGALAGKALAALRPGARARPGIVGMRAQRSPELERAYAYCRKVARREAKNFYWAFRALPRHKSDAMCAIYAFMRKADDLADDESQSVPERRAAMAAWIAEWRQASGAHAQDPLFLAVADTQQRFGIDAELLTQLVRGTNLDLEDEQPGVVRYRSELLVADGQIAPGYEADVYDTFEDLYRYCYLVASVVGLVTIRIFGYSDPRAELMAEQTGIAFQLTNILRDIREDAERGRIYLPRDDMQAANTDEADLLHAVTSQHPSPAVLALMQRELDRAAEFYRASDALIPLLDPDARPAMRVLVSIYRELLERIAMAPATVFRCRISVPTYRKLALLTRGFAGSLLARLFQ